MYRSSIAMFISSNTFISDKLTKKERSHLLCERMINIAVSNTVLFSSISVLLTRNVYIFFSFVTIKIYKNGIYIIQKIYYTKLYYTKVIIIFMFIIFTFLCFIIIFILFFCLNHNI